MPLLKERLRAKGLRVSGRKAELIDRLLDPPTDTTVQQSSPPPTASRRVGAGRAVIPADATPRQSPPPGAATLRVASWNVAGLRGLLKREEGVETMRSLLYDEAVDVLNDVRLVAAELAAARRCMPPLRRVRSTFTRCPTYALHRASSRGLPSSSSAA